jgi:glutathione synthase/RimK-type ligase-like ATP-grasp enzyme
MTVLILGGMDDEHACFMLEHLKEQGVDVELLDSRWFPADLGLAHDPLRGEWTLQLPTGRRLAGEQVRSVYWRCYNGVATPDLPDPEQAYIASNDARGLFESMLIHLPVRWVNGWQGFQLHQTKPVQLARVASLGVPIPASILANDPEAIREFAARHPHSIFKPIQGGAHTRRVKPEHLTEENLANLRHAPVTLQEEVPGTNIRVFVAGEKVLACEVRVEQLDYRDNEDPEIYQHALPAEVAEQSLRIARALDLRWTGIDFRRSPEGRYVFLEANPSPMFLGFQSRCGLPLVESLTALLVGE